jgi:ubiquinone/menaquinone biosynthesis C-methylase UbiE
LGFEPTGTLLSETLFNHHEPQESNGSQIVQDASQETHWERAAKTKMGKYLTRVETDFVSHTLSVSEQSSVMDIGAEAGRFSIFTANLHATVVGIDIDSYGLRRLKLKNRLVHLIQADARKIPLRKSLLDVVLMIEVLDYIPELEIAFGEVFGILKPMGSLVFSFGNTSSAKSRFRKLQGRSYKHGYREVMNALNKAGFKIKNKTGYNWLPFGRTSENTLIPLLGNVERVLGLRKIPRLSPWVLVHAYRPE